MKPKAKAKDVGFLLNTTFNRCIQIRDKEGDEREREREGGSKMTD